MTNIHTPEGFKVSFLSNLSGGQLLKPDAEYPKFDFPEFLPDVSKITVLPVTKTLNATTNNIDLTYDYTDIDGIKYTIIESKNVNDGTITYCTDDGISIIKPENTLEYLVEALSYVKHESLYKDVNKWGKTIGKKTSKQVTPYVATQILKKFEYPTTLDSKWFLGGTSIDNFIKQIIIPAIHEKHPNLKKLMEQGKVVLHYTDNKMVLKDPATSEERIDNFATNLKKFVTIANKYMGAKNFNFDMDNDVSKSTVKKAVNPVSRNIPNSTERLSNLLKGIMSGGESALLYGGNNEFDDIFVMNGGKVAEYNNSKLYREFFNNVIEELKSKNKTLSDASKTKVTNVINKIEALESELKTIIGTLTVIAKENNYELKDVDEIAIKSYAKLLEQKNNVSKVLNTSYIKYRDLAKTLAKVVGILGY